MIPTQWINPQLPAYIIFHEKCQIGYIFVLNKLYQDAYSSYRLIVKRSAGVCIMPFL